VTLLRRPAPRFFLIWAPALVGVAVVAGVADLPPWMIALVEFAAWALIAVCERSLSGPWPKPAEITADERAPATEPVSREAAAAVADPPAPAAPAPAEAPPVVPPPPPPEPEPVRAARSHVQAPRPAAPAEPATSTRWNVWTLEQVVQERAPENEELAFLIVYLRDFADTDGLLPAGFDSLVRESFGELLPATE